MKINAILFTYFFILCKSENPCTEKYCKTCHHLIRAEGRQVPVCEKLLGLQNCCSIYINGAGILFGGNKCSNLTREIDEINEEDSLDGNKIQSENWTEEEYKEFFKTIKRRDEICIFQRNGRLIMFGSFLALCFVVYIGWVFWREKKEIKKARVQKRVLQEKFKIGMG